MQCACAVLYCHLWPDWIYHIFRQLINDTILGKKKVTEHKNVCFDFLHDLWYISHSKKNSARYYKDVHWSSCKSIRFSRQILAKLEFSRQILGKKPLKYQLSRKIHLYRQKDMTKLPASLQNFAKTRLKQRRTMLWSLQFSRGAGDLSSLAVFVWIEICNSAPSSSLLAGHYVRLKMNWLVLREVFLPICRATKHHPSS